MRQFGFAFGLIVVAGLAAAQGYEIEDRAVFGPDDAARKLRVISTGDADLFAPLIEGFVAKRPGTSVEYIVASSAELNRAIETEADRFDVAISSAMDLQTKLVNDGLARSHRSDATLALPDWARWRDQLFAFTQEPAAVILSREAFNGLEMPRTRQQLIEVMRDNPDRFEDLVGTYDIRVSGLGYLFATQDARSAETYWRLSEVMGALGAKLYCCSSEMIDDVVAGDLAVAYNVLGSYARARKDRSEFEILLPEDFALVMLRTVFIPATSERPELAGAFVDMLLDTGVRPQSGIADAFDPGWLSGADQAVRRIPLGPALLSYLDRFKKARFIEEWANAIVQN